MGLRTYVWCVRSKVCASVCASEKGKPVVRRGRKASMGLLELVLGGGQATEQQQRRGHKPTP